MENSGNTIKYNCYSFSRDLPVGEDATNIDYQRNTLKPLDQICKESGGSFSETRFSGLEHEHLSNRYFVGTNYVENIMHIDNSGNSPKRHSFGTIINCVDGTENEVLFEKLMEFYGCKEMPSPYSSEKEIV